jgi:hypothetical protein
MTKALILCAALALAACGGKADNSDAVNAAPGSENAMAADNGAEPGNALATVLAMPDKQRNIVFVRALLDADIKCDGVVSSKRMPDSEGKPVWLAECKNGSTHMISITPDGTANIMSRSDG